MKLNTLSKKDYAALVRVIWKRENVRCFNGKLWTIPDVKIFDTHNFGAYYQQHSINGRRGTLAINRSADCCENLLHLRNTIIHEMIHQEQSQHPSVNIRIKEIHGRFFRRRANEILLIIGYDVVAMYPMRGTPGFFFTHNTLG